MVKKHAPLKPDLRVYSAKGEWLWTADLEEESAGPGRGRNAIREKKPSGGKKWA